MGEGRACNRLTSYLGGVALLFGTSPFIPYISMHIPHSVLCTFPKVPTWRICLTRVSSAVDRFLCSHELNVLVSCDIVRRNEMLITLKGLRGI